MSTLKNIIIAAATTFAVIAPLAGAAQAKPAFAKTLVAQDGALLQEARYRAGARTPRIDARIANQNRRIRRNVRRGKLTRVEALRLRSRLFAIRSARRIAKFDGRVTRLERRRLLNKLNANSQRIQRLANNRRGR